MSKPAVLNRELGAGRVIISMALGMSSPADIKRIADSIKKNTIWGIYDETDSNLR